MTTPIMNTKHSTDIARRRPRKSAILVARWVSGEFSEEHGRHVRSAEKRANESTNGKQGNDETFPDSAERAGTSVARGFAFRETEQEILHEQDVGNLTSVILPTTRQ